MTDPLAVAIVLGGFAVGLGLLEGWEWIAPRVHAVTGRTLPDDETGTLSSDLSKWVVTLLLVGYVLVVEGKGLGSLGFRYPSHLFFYEPYGGPLALAGWWVGGVAGTWLLTLLAYAVYSYLDLPTLESFASKQATRSNRARLFTAVTAGVTESVLFQAYPIERIAALSGSLVLAAVVSWLLFTGLHYGETFSAVETLYIGVPAFTMTVLYVATGSIYVVVLAHASVDALSLLGDEDVRDEGEVGPGESVEESEVAQS